MKACTLLAVVALGVALPALATENVDRFFGPPDSKPTQVMPDQNQSAMPVATDVGTSDYRNPQLFVPATPQRMYRGEDSR